MNKRLKDGGGPVIRGLFWSLAAFGLSVFSGLFSALYAYRVVGPSRYGTFVISLSILSLVTVLQSGLHQSVIAEGGDSSNLREEADKLKAVSYINLVLSFTFLVAGIVLAFIIPHLATVAAAERHETFAGVLMLGAASAISCLTATNSGVIMLRGGFEKLFYGQLAGLTVRLIVLILTLREFELASLGAASLLASMTERMVTTFFARRINPLLRLWPGRMKLNELRRVLSFSVPITLLSITGTVVASSDAIIIGALISTAATAEYRIGGLVPQQVNGLLQAAYGTLFPRVAKTSVAWTDRLRVAADLSSILSLCSGAVLGFSIVEGREIIQILFNSRSDISRASLILLMLTFTIDFCWHSPVSLSFAQRLQGRMVKWSFLELTLNLGLTIILCLVFGAAGAAGAALLTVLVMDVLVFPFIFRGAPIPGLGSVLQHGLAPLALGGICGCSAAYLGINSQGDVLIRLVGGAVATLTLVVLVLYLVQPLRGSLRRLSQKETDDS